MLILDEATSQVPRPARPGIAAAGPETPARRADSLQRAEARSLPGAARSHAVRSVTAMGSAARLCPAFGSPCRSVLYGTNALYLQRPCWTRSAPSFAPPGGVRGAGAGLRLWTAAATMLLDEVSTFHRAAKRRARSWSWAAAATAVLDEVGAFLSAAKWSARSWSGTAAATTPLDEVGAYLRAARWRSWSWTAAATTRVWRCP